MFFCGISWRLWEYHLLKKMTYYTTFTRRLDQASLDWDRLLLRLSSTLPALSHQYYLTSSVPTALWHQLYPINFFTPGPLGDLIMPAWLDHPLISFCSTSSALSHQLYLISTSSSAQSHQLESTRSTASAPAHQLQLQYISSDLSAWFHQLYLLISSAPPRQLRLTRSILPTKISSAKRHQLKTASFTLSPLPLEKTRLEKENYSPSSFWELDLNRNEIMFSSAPPSLA